MGDDPGDAADQEDRQDARVIHAVRQQAVQQERHQRPVARSEQALQGRQPPGRQGQPMLAPAPGAASGETAGQQVACGQRQEQGADQAQAVAAELPARRQGRQAAAEQDAGEQQVAEPVGHQAEGEDPGDIGDVQAEPAVQAIAQRHGADPGTQVEVERIAHEGHGEDPPLGQRVADVVAAEQVETAEHRIAGGRQQQSEEQGRGAILAEGVADFLPVEILHQQEQQHRDQHEERQGQQPAQPAPVRAARRRRGGFVTAAVHGLPRWPWRSCQRRDGRGSSDFRRGRWAGTQPAIAGKCLEKWKPRKISGARHQ